MKKLHVLLILLAVVLASCQQGRFVELSIADSGQISISLPDKETKQPICITGTNEASSIYYETSEEKFFLNGKPKSHDVTEDSFNATWEIEGNEISIKIEKTEGDYNFVFSAKENKNILGWGFSMEASPEEYFTGLFERTVDGNQTESWKEGIETAMNLRGETVEMIVKPTLSLYCPFYLSSAGYGLFIEGTWPGKYDFCKSTPNQVQVYFEGNSLSGKIYTSASPAEIVKKHALNVGPTIVPPKWAFEPWRWRDNHVHLEKYYDGTPVDAPYNSQLVEDMLMMQAYDIPCGLYWVDRPWAGGDHGYADFDWDPERFPNAKEMLDWLHEQDTRFMLWIAPWVAGDMRTEAYEKGYAQPMRTHFGIDSTSAALLDFTNPEACKWWQEKGIEKMLKQGVDGFKLDRAEETILETRDLKVHDGRTTREVRNEFPVLYVKTVNESCQKIKGDDFVLIPRAGYTGSSKYSGFWGGDIGSPAEGLRAAIIALQRSSVIGFPIWGSDIGGYWQGDLDREVCARWLAFGCFNPIMEFGPTEDRAPWDMDSEPNYDTELIAIWRLYAKIHSQLAGYSHKLAHEAHETGMPIVRPLFMEFPEQQKAWDNWETFLYGNDILIYNIWEKNVETCKVYLPAGERWRDAWNPEKVYDGGQEIDTQTPLHKIPIFIRESSNISLGDLNALYQESLEIAKNKPDLANLQSEAFK